jgi:two-component system chemotaxis family response regulator WspR
MTANTEASESIPQVTGSASMVLLVDDQAIIAQALRRLLADVPDIDLHYCCDPTEAIREANQIRPTVILQDLVMPSIDGLDLVRLFRANSETAETPIIVLSAEEDAATKSKAFAIGANDYLVKLPDRVELIARIRYHTKAYMSQIQRDEAFRALRQSQHKLLASNTALMALNQSLEDTTRTLEQAQAQLEMHASQDALTQLANRRAVDSHLAFRSTRETQFSVIYIDLNGFKKINDTYGHQAGDELLKMVGDRLRQVFRPTDIVGRWGGDEFVVLLDASFAEAQSYVSRIARGLSEEFAILSDTTEQRVKVGAAMGVATWQPGDTVSDVLQRADKEMYAQKLRKTANDGE